MDSVSHVYVTFWSRCSLLSEEALLTLRFPCVFVLVDPFAQRLIDPGLILIAVSLEPRYQVGIDPERDLLFDRTIEPTPYRLAEVGDLGNIGGVDILITLSGEPV